MDYAGIPSDERRTRALEIAVSMLGSIDKNSTEVAEQDGIGVIKHYLWLVKVIDKCIMDRAFFDDLCKQIE